MKVVQHYEKKTILDKLVWNNITKKIWRYVPDRLFVSLIYFRKFKRILRLNNPITFGDKLIKWKLTERDIFSSVCADKYLVREIVKSRVGKEYLINLHGVYESVAEINWNELPNQFVIKGTHGSQMNIICDNKDKLDINHAEKFLNEALKTNYYYIGREWQYKYQKPRLICEEYLNGDNGKDIMDFRFFCFDGEPHFVVLDIDKYGNYKRNIYDLQFKLLEFGLHYPRDENFDMKKPECFDLMIELSRKLSKGFKHVRVDLFTSNNKVYFGELTFCHSGGFQEFYPNEYNVKIGDLFKL